MNWAGSGSPRAIDEVMLVTEQGKSIRFSETGCPPDGPHGCRRHRHRLDEGDQVDRRGGRGAGGKLFLISQHGYGRCTSLDEFRHQSRGGKGVRAYKVTEKTGLVVDGRVVQDEDEIT